MSDPDGKPSGADELRRMYDAQSLEDERLSTHLKQWRLDMSRLIIACLARTPKASVTSR